MNIKSILAAALVIGSSSLALAQPAAQGGVTVQTSADIRDHRTPDYYRPAPVVVAEAPIARPIFRPLPVVRPPMMRTLANDTKISRFGRDTLTFARPLKLQSIKLQGETGRTTVSQVAIKFANGRTQLVQENKLLLKNGCIDIDLNGNVRNVTGIVIYGQSGARASFDVTGLA
ncbi:MAG: hypothetical protein ABJE66_36200 [Deltaproteobacteria bacterium]